MEDAMTVFRRTLSGQKDLSGASLATKILVTRLRREVAASPADLERAARELAAYFERHQFASSDIKTL